MNFSEFATLCNNLESIAGTELRERLAAFYTITDCPKIVSYLVLGQIDAQFKDNVIGLADKTVLKIVGQAYGASKQVNELYKVHGDVGTVTEMLHSNKPQGLLQLSSMTIQDVHTHLHELKLVKGSGSLQQKCDKIVSILARMNAVEAKYYTRILTGTLRLGVGVMAIIDALSICVHNDKRSKKELEQAYNVYPDIGSIAQEFLTKKSVEKKVTVGVPVRVMLAQRVKQLHEIEERMKYPVYADTKYDGERVQIHVNDKITLFSRRMENITEQFPDIVKMCESLPHCIIEGEIMACNASGDLLHFTDLMQRKRKHNIEQVMKKVPVRVFCFDIIYYQTSLLEKKYTERRSILQTLVEDSCLEMSECTKVETVKELNTVFTSIIESHEGLIIKDGDGPYVPGNRNFAWVKWKADYGEQVDTFDLVIVGADHGKGKRKGAYGSFMLACKDDDNFVTVTKLGTGLTDNQLSSITAKLVKSSKPTATTGSITTDVYVEPTIVVEVAAAEISKGSGHSGVALRFPRLVRIREDKSVDDITTKKEIESMR